MDDQFIYESLAEAALQLQAIIDTAIDGIITIDEHGIIDMINPAGARLFGYEPPELVGKSINMLMPEPYNEQHDEYIDRYLKTGEAQIIGIGREALGKKKDGTLFSIRLAVSEVRLSNRRMFIGIVHDLTEVKEANKRFRELNEELENKVKARTEELARVVNQLLNTNKQLKHEIREREAAERALKKQEKKIRKALEREKELSELKSRFVSMASHEFRTPLSTISSSASLIARYTDGEQQDKRLKHVHRIKSAVDNLTNILNDFLSLSRLEEGKIEPDPTEFSMVDLCHDVEGDVHGMLKSGQQLLVEKEGDIPPVFLDRHLLKNTLLNLLSNAIKYSEEGKRIWLKIGLEDERLRIVVRDEGIGIPKSDQQHLFMRFFRAKNALNIQGTGLGLNIVLRYLEILGGHIHFESEEGKGTTFVVKLPLRQKSAVAVFSRKKNQTKPQ